MNIVKRFLEGYAWVLRKAMTLLLGLLVIPVTLQIVSRYTELIPRYIWTEEAARFFFIWMIMLGSTIAVREQTHFSVDVLPKPKTPQGKAWAVLVVDFSMLLMALIFVRYGWNFVMFGYTQTSELTGINMAFIFVGFLLAGLSWVAFIGERFMENIAILREGNHGAR